MIPIQQTKNNIYTENEFIEEGEFSITPNKAAFSILCGGIYSDTIKAIIRELSTNAWDSHIMADNKHKKFEVKLPTVINPIFYVRDYGTGLSKEKVRKVYTQFFNSDKQNSNDVNGMFGLGSKTPLSYTDSFMVISYQDGFEYTYSIFFNENEKISYRLVSEISTVEENGLKIMFSVMEKDISKFQDKAKEVFTSFIETTPKLIGADFKIKEVEDRFEKLIDGVYCEISSMPNYSGSYILQSNIAYPINNIIDRNSPFNIYSKLFFLVDNGSIEYSTNREQVTNSDSNKEYILQLLNDKAEHLKTKMLCEIENYCLENRDSVKLCTRKMYSVIADSKKYFSYNYQTEVTESAYKAVKEIFGETLDEVIKIDVEKIKAISITNKDSNFSLQTILGEDLLPTSDKVLRVSYKNQKTLFIVDKKSSWKQKFKLHINKNQIYQYIVIENYNKESLEYFLDVTSHVWDSIIYVSELEKPVTIPSKNKSEKGRWFWNYSNTNFLQNNLELIPEELKTVDFCYIPVRAEKIYFPGDIDIRVDNLKSFCRELEIENLVFVNNTYAKNVSKNYPNSKNVFDVFAEKIIEKYPTYEAFAQEAANALNDNINSSILVLFKIINDIELPLKKQYLELENNNSIIIQYSKLTHAHEFKIRLFEYIYLQYNKSDYNSISTIINLYYEEKYPIIYSLQLGYYYFDRHPEEYKNKILESIKLIIEHGEKSNV
jgi:hypothetical protein